MSNLNVVFIFNNQTRRITGYELLSSSGKAYSRADNPLEVSKVFTVPEDAPVLTDPKQFQMTEDLQSVEAVSTETLADELGYAERVTASHDALAYLASTDWYVTRLMEAGTAIPEAVIANRSAAREKVLPEHKET